MKMANDFKHSISFKGTLLLEPKPQEPTKHQYDWDAATTIAFLHKYGLVEDFKLNIECNHATLSGVVLFLPLSCWVTSCRSALFVVLRLASLYKYGRVEDFKLNIECNHATLSGADDVTLSLLWCVTGGSSVCEGHALLHKYGLAEDFKRSTGCISAC
jgi:xylose isomerase